MRKLLSRVAVLVGVGVLVPSSSALAAYTEAMSTAVQIESIYVNEWGSPFITFKTQVNPNCHNGNGLYLYNLEMASITTEVMNLRKAKLAQLLAAKAIGKAVVLHYFHDASRPAGNWDRCYIHGVKLIDD